MTSKLPRCTICGRAFRPNRYNADRQRCRGRGECVRECTPLRQREWYARKCRDDPAFAEKARKRCAAANRRRREREKASVPVPPPPPPPPPPREPVPPPPEATPQALFEVVSGLLSQLTDTSDPVLLQASMCQYRERGRRLALDHAGTHPEG